MTQHNVLILGTPESKLTSYKTLRSLYGAIKNQPDVSHGIYALKRYQMNTKPLRSLYDEMGVVFIEDADCKDIFQDTDFVTVMRFGDIISDNMFKALRAHEAQVYIPEYLHPFPSLRLEKIVEESMSYALLHPAAFLSTMTFSVSNIKIRDICINRSHLLTVDPLIFNKAVLLKTLQQSTNNKVHIIKDSLYCTRVDTTDWITLWLDALHDTNFNITETNNVIADQENPTTHVVSRNSTMSFRSRARSLGSRAAKPHTIALVKDLGHAFRQYREAKHLYQSVTVNNKGSLFSEALLKTWGCLNGIEPLVRPSRQFIDNCIVTESNEKQLFGRVFHELVQTIESEYLDHIVLLPHLNRGGADLAALHLVNTLSVNQRILVITTGYVESEWLSKIDSKVRKVELHKNAAGLNEELRLQILVRILQAYQPKYLTIINSYQGYELLRLYKNTIPHSIKVMLHTYAFDMTNDGFLFNFIEDGIPNTYPRVDVYVTDSKSYATQLGKVQGIEYSKIKHLYLPVVSSVNPHPTTNKQKRVLWASRISQAKLVEVAVDTARILGKKGIVVDFYGVIEPDYLKANLFKKLLKQAPIANYKGAFDGFDKLPHDDYDVFLLTSKNEGMPNVVIDALKANHYVVAPTVGGIPEVITHHVNGALVEDRFDPMSYANEIQDYYGKIITDDYVDMRSVVNAEVCLRHTQEQYYKNLKKLYTD